MSEESTSVRSARDVKISLLRNAFREGRGGVVARIHEICQRVAKESEGSKLLIAKFNFEHFPETRKEKADALVAQREGHVKRSPFSAEIPAGARPN